VLVLAALVVAGARADSSAGDGLAAFKAGRYEEALEAFRAEAAAHPESAEAAANVGATLARLGRNDEAARELERALTLGPAPRVEAAIRFDLGNAELALDRVEAAIESYKASLRLVPGDREAKANLEIALRRRREPPPPPPGDGGGGASGPASSQPQPPAAAPGAPRMTREEAERLLDALGKRERLELPHGARRPATDPSVPDW